MKPLVIYGIGGSDQNPNAYSLHPRNITPCNDRVPQSAHQGPYGWPNQRTIQGKGDEFRCWCCGEGSEVGVGTFLGLIEMGGGYAYDHVRYAIHSGCPGFAFDIVVRKTADLLANPATAPNAVVVKAGVDGSLQDDDYVRLDPVLYLKQYHNFGGTPAKVCRDHAWLGLLITAMPTSTAGCAGGCPLSCLDASFHLGTINTSGSYTSQGSFPTI